MVLPGVKVPSLLRSSRCRQAQSRLQCAKPAGFVSVERSPARRPQPAAPLAKVRWQPCARSFALCAAAAQALLLQPAACIVPCPQDPFAEKATYSDGPWERFAMKLFTTKMAGQLGAGLTVPGDVTYDDLLRVSKEIMRGRSSPEQRAVVRNILSSLLPPGFPAFLR